MHEESFARTRMYDRAASYIAITPAERVSRRITPAFPKIDLTLVFFLEIRSVKEFDEKGRREGVFQCACFRLWCLAERCRPKVCC